MMHGSLSVRLRQRCGHGVGLGLWVFLSLYAVCGMHARHTNLYV